VERVVLNALGKESASLRDEKHRVEGNTIHLLPPDLPSFVLFFEPAHKRFEVFHHRAGDFFPDDFSQNFIRIRLDFGATFYLDW
jgi:hypothetical protein